MSRLSFLQDKLGKNGLRMSVLELSYIKVIQVIYTSILKQIHTQCSNKCCTPRSRIQLKAIHHDFKKTAVKEKRNDNAH